MQKPPAKRSDKRPGHPAESPRVPGFWQTSRSCSTRTPPIERGFARSIKDPDYKKATQSEKGGQISQRHTRSLVCERQKPTLLAMADLRSHLSLLLTQLASTFSRFLRSHRSLYSSSKTLPRRTSLRGPTAMPIDTSILATNRPYSAKVGPEILLGLFLNTNAYSVISQQFDHKSADRWELALHLRHSIFRIRATRKSENHQPPNSVLRRALWTGSETRRGEARAGKYRGFC